MKAGGISIHAVDVASGRPAQGLRVRLLQVTETGPEVIAEGACGETGLFDDPTVLGQGITGGRYIAEFFIGDFFAAQNSFKAADGFLDVAIFPFSLPDPTQHYHLPLKFTAWGYSLFRGGL